MVTGDFQFTLEEIMKRELSRGTKTGEVVQKILFSPLFRMLVGCTLCAVVSLGINALFKAMFGLVGFDATLARGIRSLVFIATVLLTYYWLFRKYERRSVTEMSIKHLPVDALWGSGAGVLCVGIVLSMCALPGAFQIISFEFQLRKVVIGFVVVLAAATFEEVIFRGVIFRIAENWLGTNLAISLSALLFGLAHLRNDRISVQGLLSAIVGGVAVAMMFVLTKRLWVPIFFHAAWNYSQIVAGITLSGLSDYSELAILKSKLYGPEWLTGGTVGIEASIVTILLLLIAIVGLYYRSWKTGQIISRLSNGVQA